MLISSRNSRLIVKIALISFVIMAFYVAYMVFLPRMIPNGQYKIMVSKSVAMPLLAKTLVDDGIIDNKPTFLFLLRLSGKDRNVVAGIYVLKNSISMWGVVKRLIGGKPDEISISLLDGWTIKQLRSYIDKLPDIAHITTHLSDVELKNLLKINMPNMEGLFFPSTYFIAPNQTDLEIYQGAYRLMQNKVAAIYAKRNANISYSNPYQMIIMASLIEKETNKPDDMFVISTVFNNRLRAGMKLQDDPAVFYGLQDQVHVTRKDFQINTPYNTYLHYGLPPTPICIPSENALIAASNPGGDSKLLYFVATGDGHTKFADTYKEHVSNVKQYLHKKEKK